MKTAPVPPPLHAPDLSRRVRLIASRLFPTIARRPCQPHPAGPLIRRLNRIARRFEHLLARLAAGRLPRIGHPHTTGAPHPGNLLRGNPLLNGNRWLLGTPGWEVP